MKNINKHIIKNIVEAFLFVLTLILVSFFFIQADVKKSLEREYTMSLAQIVNDVNTKIENNLYAFGYNNFDMFQKTTHLSRFFDYYDDTKKYLVEIQAELYDIQSTQGVFSKIILYRSSDGMALTGREGSRIITDSDAATSAFFDIPEIIKKFELNHSLPIVFYSTNDQCVIFAYPIINHNYYYNKMDRFSGFVSMYVSLDYLLSDVISVADQDMTLLVLDADNHMFFSHGNNILSTEIILNEVWANLTEGSGKYSRHIASNKYDFYWDKSSTYDLTFIYYRQNNLISRIDANYISENIFFLISLAVLSLIMLILFSILEINKHKYNKKLLPTPHSASQLQHSSVTDASALKFKIMIDLLYGNISPEEYKAITSFIFDYKELYTGYAVILVIFDDSTFESSSSFYKENISIRIQKILNNYLESNSISSLCIIHPSVNLSCLINVETNKNLRMLNESLLKLLSTETDIGFNIFYTSICADSRELSKNYRFLRAQTRYSYIYNYYNIFSCDELAKYESMTSIIPDDYMNNVTKLLNSGNIESLKKYIQQASATIKASPHSYGYSQNFIMTTLHIVSKSLKEQDVSSSEFVNSLQPSFEKSDTFDKQIDFIMQCLDEYKSSTLRYNSIIGQRYLTNIVNYIEANITTVNLADISKNFNISQSHFSRIFKDNMDINFSDFVSAKKLESATHMLTDTPTPIAEIAKALGYDAPAYFSKKFKERYGLTPMLYRKKFKVDADNLPDGSI